MEIYLESAIFILILTTISVSGNLFCGENERFSICGNNECRATCKLPQGPPSCDPKCRPGCICLKGLVRRERDDTCVKIEECFKSPSSRTFLQKRPGCPPKKKQIPVKRPYIRQRRGPQCRRRFPQKGQKGPDDDKEAHFPLAENDNNETKLKEELQKEYEKALNKIKDAIEKSKGLQDDAIKKLKEIRKKMKKNNVKVEKKGKDLLKKIKKAKDAEKKILDKINAENNEHRKTTSRLVSGKADFAISIHIWQENKNANR